MDRWKRTNSVWLDVLALIVVTILLHSGPGVSSCSGADKEAPSKTVVDLQPFRETNSMGIKGARDEEGLASLINLNPNINAWYVLRLKRPKAVTEENYHLENANPLTQRPLLDTTEPRGLLLSTEQKRDPCELWGTTPAERLKAARDSRVPYATLCDSRLYLRNPTKGHQTPVEAATDFLRKRVPGGDEIVSFVRDTFFAYLYQEKAIKTARQNPKEDFLGMKENPDGPAPALLDSQKTNRRVKPIDLGIQIDDEPGSNGMVPGTWYDARDNPGIYVSTVAPSGITPEIMNSYRNVVSRLDSVESAGLAYLVAFDLGRFDLHFSLGTVHPGVGWSEHIPDRMKDRSLPGPDGIATIGPLVSTGLINPMDAPRTVAAFTGGFKREHGAFRYGPLAIRNHGSHYGFVENGVLFSTLQPGLSTIYVLKDGWTDMKTWTGEDNLLLPGVRYARQNGVPIIADFDHASQLPVPGPFVAAWGEGNWSGSVDQKLRTLRAGAALQEFKGRRFLIYGFFWSATPSAMARVFQAYQCRYAMLLDMNALVHTYLAIYRRQGLNLYVQHLIKGMSEVDMTVKERYIPRFLGYPDDRDFFYLTRKEAP